MNNGNGFILLHKSLEKHWISNNAEYFKAWVFMLFNACYEPYKILCKGQLIPIEYGEIALSYDQWVKKFGKNWTLQKVRTFFDLLENDKMITRSEGYKITKLNIVNFATYQTEQQPNNKIKVKKLTGIQQVDNKQVTTIETIETIFKQEKQENTPPVPVSSDYPSFFKTETKALFEDYWKNRVKKKFAMTPYARKLLLSTITKISNENDEYAFKVIQKSLLSSWGDFFALKDSAGNEIEPPSKEQPDKKSDKIIDPWEKYKTVKEVIDFFYTYVEQGQNIEAMIEFMKDKDPHLNSNEKENIKQVYKWGLKLINSGTYKINEKTKLNDMRWGLTV